MSIAQLCNARDDKVAPPIKSERGKMMVSVSAKHKALFFWQKFVPLSMYVQTRKVSKMNFRSYSRRSTWVTFSSRAKGTTLCVGLNILLGHLGCMGNGLEGEKARGGGKRGRGVGTPVHGK